jgi:hypothetical protein
MPRSSALAQEVVAFAIAGPPMEPPGDLDEAAARFWRELVPAFPAERFGPDDVPLLRELCRHQAIAAKVHEQISKMRRWTLNAESACVAKRRAVFLQLLRMAGEETRLIVTLCVKLRLATQSRTEKRGAEAEHSRMPVGPRPWDTSAGQH